jgi:hypothetical protein
MISESEPKHGEIASIEIGLIEIAFEHKIE